MLNNPDSLFNTIFTVFLFNKEISWTPIVIILVMLVLSNIHKLKRYYNYFDTWKTNSSVSVKGTVRTTKFQTDFMFPTEFEAIIWHLLGMSVNLKSVEIIRICGKFKKKTIYVPSAITKLEIADGIYLKADIDRYDSENDHIKEYEVTLYSYTKSFADLNRYVVEIVKKYKKNERYKLQNQHKFFSVIRDKESSDNYFLDTISTDFKSNKRFDNIFFNGKETLLLKLDNFLNNEQHYNDKGIPYTLGIMLYGVPGCGKSSTIKAVANYTKRHIFEINLSKIKTCSELLKLFTDDDLDDFIVPIDKRIIVMEDIDCMMDIVQKRTCKLNKNEYDNDNDLVDSDSDVSDSDVSDRKSKNSKKNSKMSKFMQNFKKNYDTFYDEPLNLSFILNLIDGVMEQSGRIIIITTNYPEKLDDALIRPGRVDIKIEFKQCDKYVMQDIIEHFYDVTLDAKDVDNFEEHKYTPAEIIGLCNTYINDIDVTISSISKH